MALAAADPEPAAETIGTGEVFAGGSVAGAHGSTT